MNLSPSRKQPSHILNDENQKRIAKVLYLVSGIDLPSNKRALVQARLSKRISELGIQDFDEYCQMIEDSRNSAERNLLITALTTNVTKFFREGHHFNYLRDNLLSGFVDKARRGESVRIWSAGCSSGEEPLTVAMTILEKHPEAGSLDIKIMATDIDEKILKKARSFSYSPEETTNIPPAFLRSFFDASFDKSHFTAKSSVKQMINYSQLNLNENWSQSTKYDIIFCRNVVIYFSPDSQNTLWRKFANNLKPGGHMMIGHSERIPSELGAPIKLVAPSTYQKPQLGDI